MQYLNLGCGSRFKSFWTNINFQSTGEGVIAHNLRAGIPCADRSFDVVYHSHLLEHFARAEAEFFIKECYRVLRPHGILRVVVPDLETITRMYLNCLENTSSGIKEYEQKYEWMMLELYDQTVRNQAGGEMKNFLTTTELVNREFIIKRCGIEIENIIIAGKNQTTHSNPQSENKFKKLIQQIYRLLRYPDYRHQIILQIILSSTELKALQIGQFRQSGEVHQWMYDRYSLFLLLRNAGLEKIVVRSANESYISEWENFNLDTEPDGSIYKPDSLYMEAVKIVR
jgi:predicted SAM-dependent methyltransferase